MQEMQGNHVYAFDLQVNARFDVQEELEQAVSRLCSSYGGTVEMLQGDVQTLALRVSFADAESQRQAEKAVRFLLARLAESELMSIAES